MPLHLTGYLYIKEGNPLVFLFFKGYASSKNEFIGEKGIE